MERVALNTTELLSKNLTDFLEEVRLDICKNKYGGELTNGIFATTDIIQFLKRISNNFDLRSVIMISVDIYNWLVYMYVDDDDNDDDDGFVMSIVTEQIEPVLNHEIYLHVFNETLSNLRNNHNYKNEIIERLIEKKTNAKWTEKIEPNIIRAYNDAFNKFKTLSNKPQQKHHFTYHYTDKERKNLFNGLVSNGFISNDTNINHFNFVFGGTETADFMPLQWQAGSSLLAYFIDTCFSGSDSTNHWKITETCFTIKWQKPKINSLKNTVCKYGKYKNKPKGSDKIDNILKNL